MTLDLGILSVVILSGLMGAMSGALKQAASLIGLVFACLAFRPLAAVLTPMLAERLGYPPAAVKVGLSMVLFSVLFGVGTLASRAVLKKLAGDREKSRADRAIGFALGAGKAGAIAFVLLSAVLFFEKAMAEAMGETPFKMEGSRIADLARRHNLFDSIRLPALDKLRKLAAAAKDPKAAEELMNDPKVKKLLEDPNLKALLQDPATAKALQSGDLSTLLKDPRLAAFLKDSGIAEP